MGDCRYCGKSAGFLRKEHKECAAAHAQGLDSIGNVCVEAALHGVEVNQLPSKVPRYRRGRLYRYIGGGNGGHAGAGLGPGGRGGDG